MISFIETEHFKKLDCFRADFTEGTNLIIGENAMGKTTIFNVVRFALYGTAAIAASAENIPTWGNKNCTVKVGFTDDFLVVRTLKDCKVYKAGPGGTLTEDPELKVAEGNKPCTEWVKEHLGLDHKMFSIFNMSMQGETGALITLGATALNQIVENFSGVGVLDVVIKSLSQEKSQLEGAVGTVEHTDITERGDELEKALKCIEVCTADVAAKSSDVAAADQGKSDADASYRQAVKHNEQVALQEVKKSSAKSVIETLAPQLTALEVQTADLSEQMSGQSCENFEGELKLASDSLKSWEADSNSHTHYSSMIETLQSRIVGYSDKAKLEQEVELKKISVGSKITEQAKKVSDLHDKRMELAGKYNDAKNAVEHGSCETCHRAFENFDEEAAIGLMGQAKVVFDTARLLENTAVTVLDTLNKELRGLPNHGKDNALKMQECQEELQGLTETVSALEEKWEDFDDEAVQESIKNFRAKLSDINSLRTQLAKSQSELVTAKQSHSRAVEMFESINVLEKFDTDQLAATCVTMKNLADSYRSQLDMMSQELSQFKTAAHIESADLNRIRTANEKFAKYNVEIDRSKRLMKFLRDKRTDYMEGVWSLILGAATGWINQTTQGWISAVGRNPNGDFTFTENGIVAPVYSEASGAQKEFIGVALRIGLGMSLKGDHAMLMLDEPTAGMTETNADVLATGLLGVSGQKIVITHRQSEKLTASNVIRL